MVSDAGAVEELIAKIAAYAVVAVAGADGAGVTVLRTGDGPPVVFTHKRTRPYRPQTNGKTDRFHRTPADCWAYARYYDTKAAREQALPGWLHFWNHHRAQSAIGGLPPISKLTNLPGHHS